MKTFNPLESIQTTVLTTSRSLMQDADMAWLYLIVSPHIYEQKDIFNAYLNRFYWQSSKERLIQLNQNFQSLLNNQVFLNSLSNMFLSH